MCEFSPLTVESCVLGISRAFHSFDDVNFGYVSPHLSSVLCFSRHLQSWWMPINSCCFSALCQRKHCIDTPWERLLIDSDEIHTFDSYSVNIHCNLVEFDPTLDIVVNLTLINKLLNTMTCVKCLCISLMSFKIRLLSANKHMLCVSVVYSGLQQSVCRQLLYLTWNCFSSEGHASIKDTALSLLPHQHI